VEATEHQTHLFKAALRAIWQLVCLLIVLSAFTTNALFTQNESGLHSMDNTDIANDRLVVNEVFVSHPPTYTTLLISLSSSAL